MFVIGVDPHKGTHPEFLTTVEERVAAYRAENGLAADTRVPVDAVTASASGLDLHISLANARLQAARVAGAAGWRSTVSSASSTTTPRRGRWASSANRASTCSS